MIIKLCYKEYTAKLSLAACKDFYEQTGKDLNYVLMCYLETCRESGGLETSVRLRKLFDVESFDTIAKLFVCVINASESSVPLEEIEDAMFRVGWMLSNNDDGLSNPWPLVVTALANDVSGYYAELDKKKVTT
jgi:hypothetical protein